MCCNPASTLLPCLCCKNKVFIVTGANTGIGFETSKELALLGGHVVLGCRNRTKAQKALALCNQELQECGRGGSVEYLPLSLDSTNSINSFVKQFQAKHTRLDCIVCSAGINTTSDPDNDVFAVNFMSHFYLVSLLLDMLRDTGTIQSPARVVTLSSAMHVAIPKHKHNLVAWDEIQAQGSSEIYSYSKLALHLMANYINHHEAPLIRGISVNPGAVNSQIWRGSSTFVQSLAGLLFLSTKQGSQPSVYGAASPSIVTMVRRGDAAANIYLTPYMPVVAQCRSRWYCCCCSSSSSPICQRSCLLLTNVMEATCGCCLFGGACVGDMSNVAKDEQEAEHLWKYARKACMIHKRQVDTIKKD
jgi:retinol dehydrogenase-13